MTKRMSRGRSSEASARSPRSRERQVRYCAESHWRPIFPRQISSPAVLPKVAAKVKAWQVFFLADGTLVCGSGGSDGGFLIFWKADQDKEFHKLKLPNTARDMDLHPDGLHLATAHHDHHVRISKLTPKPAPAKKG